MIDVSPFVKTLNNLPVAVFGLGLSNRTAVSALVAAGARVMAWDDNKERRAEAAKDGAEIRDLAGEDLSDYACLVLAPGVPLHYPVPHPVVQKARAAGLEIICDMEILHRCAHGRRVIGITGTNGKSTTTALIGHILRENGIAASVGGNIGTAVLDLDMPSEDGVFVLEISSYQLDLCPTFAPDIAVLLNITPDHIDRHGNLENYARAKEAIFRGSGRAVIGMDDALCRKIADRVEKRGERDVNRISAASETVSGIETPALRGDHNRQNMAAAYEAARFSGLSGSVIRRAIKTFPGLPHRQYPVARINGVLYINDSKATNAEATAKALACYENIYWIVGGQAKEGGLAGLEPYRNRIAQAFVIGADTTQFKNWLEQQNISYVLSKTLAQAVRDAHDRVRVQGAGTVLLSPACASFDQFRNFEERGNVFTAIVREIEREAAV